MLSSYFFTPPISFLLYPTETIPHSAKMLTNVNYATHVCMLLQIDWHHIALKIPANFSFFLYPGQALFLFADPNLCFFHPLDFINMPYHSVRFGHGLKMQPCYSEFFFLPLSVIIKALIWLMTWKSFATFPCPRPLLRSVANNLAKLE